MSKSRSNKSRSNKSRSNKSKSNKSRSRSNKNKLTLKNNHKHLKINTNDANHAKLMKDAPSIFKGHKSVVIVDEKCGNIYVHINDEMSHLSIHYLHNNLKTNTCEYWNIYKKNTNIHYKINKTATSKPIYIPIYKNSKGKYTYNSNKMIEAKHQRLINWVITKLEDAP